MNYAGILFIILAVALFVTEALTPGFGIWFTAGLAALVFGLILLFRGGDTLRIDWWLIVLVALIIVGVAAFVVERIAVAHRRQAGTGSEELIGKKAVVKEALNPEGTVFFKGELWTAVSNQGRIDPGVEVIIEKINGLVLTVTRKE